MNSTTTIKQDQQAFKDVMSFYFNTFRHFEEKSLQEKAQYCQHILKVYKNLCIEKFKVAIASICKQYEWPPQNIIEAIGRHVERGGNKREDYIAALIDADWLKICKHLSGGPRSLLMELSPHGAQAFNAIKHDLSNQITNYALSQKKPEFSSAVKSIIHIPVANLTDSRIKDNRQPIELKIGPPKHVDKMLNSCYGTITERGGPVTATDSINAAKEKLRKARFAR